MYIIFNNNLIVLLTDIFPTSGINSWSEGSRKFLGKLVTINEFSSDIFNIKEDGQQQVFHRDHVVRIANAEELANLEEIRRKEKEKDDKRKAKELKEFKKKAIFTPDGLKDIAISIFGEERVDITTNMLEEESEDEEGNIIDGKVVYVIIHFPEFTIRNSAELSHPIKDLYVKISISNITPNESYKASLQIHGRRTAFSVKELQSGYAHSHLSGGTGNLKLWRSFCMGSSDFYTAFQNLRMSLLAEDWELLFLSLENYVAWESLEGGPYQKIKDISSGGRIGDDEIERELEGIKPYLPIEVFTFGESLEIIDGHPLLYETFNKYSKLRNLKQESNGIVENWKEQIKAWEKLQFKGNDVEFRVISEETPTEHISKELVDRYVQLLKQQSKKFTKRRNYDRIKNSSEFLREVGIN